MLHPETLTLALLAGGAGRRLGGLEKGLLRLGGRTFAEVLADALGPLCRERLVVTSRPEPWAGWRVVPDFAPGLGAPGAWVAALEAAHTPWVLVVAVDMPRLDADAVRPLLEVAPGENGRCYRRKGRLEGLCAVVRREVAATAKALLGQGPSVQRLVAECGLTALDAEAHGVARALDGVNTPDDFAAL